ncbi:hypothetical protein QA600_17635 [Natronococcus sp. A-GB1]|uniref:hypothetical protein n=1 Tax=Natronococcus sp. A-GB1 TaxID=3037648 RepID=UPI00241CC02E|nr:hypothetical protein [Natronococcus sp. A-GB1]MDG5761154.1 hypothetical protein [Natronococcus sp. A-GB1]
MSGRLVGTGILLAVVTSGLVSWLTGSLAILGATPSGIAVYLFVGVAGPQYVLSRRLDDPLRLGVAVLAAVGALLALGWGVLGADLHGEVGVGLTAVLAVVVFGVFGGAVVREFRAGYRGETA